MQLAQHKPPKNAKTKTAFGIHAVYNTTIKHARKVHSYYYINSNVSGNRLKLLHVHADNYEGWCGKGGAKRREVIKPILNQFTTFQSGLWYFATQAVFPDY